MKTSNKEQQNNNRQNTLTFSDLMVFEARKMWASSECVSPDDVELAFKKTREYFSKEASCE